MAAIVGIAPGQGLRARGFENILGAAIGEGVHGETVAMPDQGSARASAITRRLVNTTSILKGKPEMVWLV